MHQIAPYRLWLGHIGDARDLRAVLSHEIAAVIDLALNEPPLILSRELTYCRFPLVDGAGNPPWLLRAAIQMTAGLLRSDVPALVVCSMGMSRSPAIGAAALSLFTTQPPEECLAVALRSRPADVSPGLWRDVVAVLTNEKGV